MRATSSVLLLSLAVALTGSLTAQAGPQSILDPYAGVQAPRSASKETPRTVTFTGKSVQLKSFGTGKAKSDHPEGAAPAATAADGGMLAGTKQIGDGIAKTTKGAVGGVMNGTKKIGSGIANGVKSSGLFLTKGCKAVGHGIASAGAKTAVVPKKMGEGLKVTGEKLKDGSLAATQAVAKAPKAIGHGMKVGGEKMVDGTQAVGGKIADTSGSVAKGFGRLNPFKHKGESHPVATASSPNTTK